MLRPPTPRLLPATIVALAAVLTMKSVDLVLTAIPGRTAARLDVLPHAILATLGADRSAGGGMVPAAQAAETTTPPPPKAEPQGAAKQPDAKATAAAAPAKPAEPPISDAERKILLDLRQRRQELDQRESAVAAREAVLAAAEAKLEGRVDQLQSLQTRLEALDSERQKREEAGWQGLVKTYETMKPRDAAAIFNDLDMPVLLQVVDRMKDAKAAAVLAAMRVDKARELTDQLAQMRAKRNTVASAG
jgi:flagellar motility protein MotE (MotC chaperone)